MLLEDLATSAEAEIASLTTKLQQAKAELSAAKKQASAVYHQGQKLENLPHVNRLQSLVTSLSSKLEAAHKKKEIQAAQRSAHAQLANIDREQVKVNNRVGHGEAISRGFQRWNEVYNEYGGEKGFAKELYRRAMLQTNNGVQDLDVIALAREIGVEWRNLYRKLEHDVNLAAVARLMPKNR